MGRCWAPGREAGLLPITARQGRWAGTAFRGKQTKQLRGWRSRVVGGPSRCPTILQVCRSPRKYPLWGREV